VQQPQPLGQDLRRKKIDASSIAAWPGKADDQPMPDRVPADAKRNRDRRGGSFGCNRSRIAKTRWNSFQSPFMRQGNVQPLSVTTG
jgi:hypothetical protein